ncbi:cofilin-2-like [Heptranchias perlo]|uniref:cofilin-2-like n=1 Tax=Heptranchias perlo TaxID=212740 RepID=UPI00355940DF
MASGIKVCDGVVDCFNNMKVRKSCSQEEIKRRKKAILLRVDDAMEKIILYPGKEILVGDVQAGIVADPFQVFISMLPVNDCCYAIYDASFETKETKKEELVFIHWAPDNAPVQRKMVYASSKDALRKKFHGIKHEWQVTSMEELLDLSTLASKLGSDVISVESQKVM